MTRIGEAARRLEGRVRRTPFVPSAALSKAAGVEVYAKHEHVQHTGSFKLRGAFNRLLGEPAARRAGGVVTASSGNHGAAVAYACRDLGAKCTVYVAEGANATKLEKIRLLGGEIQVVGTDGLEAEVEAKRVAASSGQLFVSPYNDVDVVAGQGTIAVEMTEDGPPLDRVYVAVGGGGLIGGIAGWLAKRSPRTVIVGAQPVNSAVMMESIRAGRLLDLPSLPTLSDGTAGGIEADAITFPLALALVDAWCAVSEEEIASAMAMWRTDDETPIEGAAGVAIAAMLRDAGRLQGRVGVVLCGGNC